MFKLSLYFHTLKYLRFTQVFHRILKKLKHPNINTFEEVCISSPKRWVIHELHQQKLIDDSTVSFLNHKGSVINKEDWNKSTEEKLWLYNLHYFEDLNSFGAFERRVQQAVWLNKWIDDNPAVDSGNGWEPYTLSLRIVNWVKAFISGMSYDQKMLGSLAQQADFLSQDLEKHLLGNHYFVNLKALIFAGCFLKGKESEVWFSLAFKSYEKELKEQVLADGGSFELSPMYHSIMLADLLDLFNLFNAYPSRVPTNLVKLTQKTIVKMFGWLQIMNLGDDKVSFFNDSAFGIAPENTVLREYATKLGFTVNELELSEEALVVHNMQNSGYVSVKTSAMSLIADLAPVGPSYIPGHAHADSLAFELSLGDSRIFVNSGTSLYGMSKERLRQRGTTAHNTVVINNKNSSEVWSGFRVARRANIGNRVIGNVTPEQTVEFSAAHNGYKKQGINCIHHRTWKVSPTGFEMSDVLQGEFDSALGFLHLHPDIKVISFNNSKCILHSTEYEIELEVIGADLVIDDSTWHPEFGVVIASHKLTLRYKQPRVTYLINWKKL